MSPHRVAVLAFDGMAPFELGVVVEVFGLPRPELGDIEWYALDVCAESPGARFDAVGGFVLGASAVWVGALGTGNHVRGIPRLVDRGTYEDDEEPSADLSRSA